MIIVAKKLKFKNYNMTKVKTIIAVENVRADIEALYIVVKITLVIIQIKHKKKESKKENIPNIVIGEKKYSKEITILVN